MTKRGLVRRGFALLGVVVLAISGAMPPVPVAVAQSGFTPRVRLPFPQEDGSLTPYSFELGYPLMTLVYDTLLWRDEKGAPRPWLARSVEMAPNGKQVTIRLAPGARWHDGRPVTAADVVFTFDFMAKHPQPRFTPQLRAVQRTSALDPLTVEVSLRSPSPGFLDQPLADMPILPAHLWGSLPPERSVPDGMAIGSGPYRLVDHQAGRSYHFEANAEYFAGPPAVKAIDVSVVTDAGATLEALEGRRVDMVPLSLSKEEAARAKGQGIRLLGGPSYLGTVLVLNVRQPPFDRLVVRQAISKALDLIRITRSIGDAVPAERGYLHPDSQWSSPETLHMFDENAARQVLAGYRLPPIEILAPDNDPVKVDAGRQVALALQRAGLAATTKDVPRDALARAVGEDGSPPSFQAAIGVAPPLASYDPDFLRRVFGSDRDAALNEAGYTSSEFDGLAERIATTVDPVARRAATSEALRLLATDVPVVPLFFSNGTYAYRPAVHDGWLFIKGSGILDKRSFLEPSRARPEAEPGADQPNNSSGLPLGLMALVLGGVALIMATIGIMRRGS